MKKYAALRGEVKGLIKPATKNSEIYVSMASSSGLDRWNNLLEGKMEPGIRSMAQSYGLWGDNTFALSPINAGIMLP